MSNSIIGEFLNNYKECGEYFSAEYRRTNSVLRSFIKQYPQLDNDTILECCSVLSGNYDWDDKFAIADLLYKYKPINGLLLHPMLNCAIALQDPSFNRIFLKPCMASYGVTLISKMLTRKFKNGDLIIRTSIASLLYWIQQATPGDARELFSAIRERVTETDNLVELYFYQLRFSKPIKPGLYIPTNAMELTEAIKGHQEYEHMLYNQLRWKRPEADAANQDGGISTKFL